MDDLIESSRRQNDRAAQIVQYGLSLQFTAGANEAKRYLIDHGIPIHVIERVLSQVGAPHRSCQAVKGYRDRREI